MFTLKKIILLFSFLLLLGGTVLAVDDYKTPLTKSISMIPGDTYEFKINSVHKLKYSGFVSSEFQFKIDGVNILTYPKNNVANGLKMDVPVVVTVNGVPLTVKVTSKEAEKITLELSSPGASCVPLNQGLVLETTTGSGLFKICDQYGWQVCDLDKRRASLTKYGDTICNYNPTLKVSEWFECDASNNHDTKMKTPGKVQSFSGIFSKGVDYLCYNRGDGDRWYGCFGDDDAPASVQVNMVLGPFFCSILNEKGVLDIWAAHWGEFKSQLPLNFVSLVPNKDSYLFAYKKASYNLTKIFGPDKTGMVGISLFKIPSPVEIFEPGNALDHTFYSVAYSPALFTDLSFSVGKTDPIDLDSDGKNDIFVTNSEFSSVGKFNTLLISDASLPPPVVVAPALVSADLDGNGVVNKDDIAWIKNYPKLMWEEKLKKDMSKLNDLITAMIKNWSS